MGQLDVDEMKRGMTLRSYLGWQRYWTAEPWGPWRDNMHTALLAREIRRPQLKRNAKIDLDDFMLRGPLERSKEKVVGFIQFLRSIAKVRKRGE